MLRALHAHARGKLDSERLAAMIHPEAEMATPFRSIRRIAASYPRNVLQCIRVAIEVALRVMDGASDLRDDESTAACLRYAFQDTDWSRKRAAGWSSRLAVRKGIRTNFQNCPADDSGAAGPHAQLARHVIGQRRGWRPAHQLQRLPDAIVGDDAEER